MNTRAHMSKFAQKWADKWVGDSLTRMENAGVTPTQDHKTILGWLHGNEMGQIASFFLDCVTGKHGNNIHEFYIDTRVSGKPVVTMYSGYVGKRDVNAALRRLQEVRKNGIRARKNPRSVTIEGTLWRDSYGNTYHRAYCYVDGKHVLTTPITYGYGTQFDYTGWQALADKGIVPALSGAQPPFRAAQDAGIVHEASYTHVKRKKDL